MSRYDTPNFANRELYVEAGELGDVKIYLSKSDGKFYARLGNDYISRKDMAAVKAEINKLSRGSVVVVHRPAHKGHYSEKYWSGRSKDTIKIGDRWYFPDKFEEPTPVEVVAIEGDKYRLREGGLDYHGESYCLPNPEVFAELIRISKEFAQVEARFMAEWDTLVDLLPVLSRDEMKELLAKSREQGQSEPANGTVTMTTYGKKVRSKSHPGPKKVREPDPLEGVTAASIEELGI